MLTPGWPPARVCRMSRHNLRLRLDHAMKELFMKNGCEWGGLCLLLKQPAYLLSCRNWAQWRLTPPPTPSLPS